VTPARIAFSSETGTGSRQENAIKPGDQASELIGSDLKMLEPLGRAFLLKREERLAALFSWRKPA
jgi:hypothetical protein